MANMKVLSSSNMPNSSFKLSTISKQTIEVHSNFSSQKSAISGRYDEVVAAMNKISSQMTSDVSKYKKKLDSKKIKKMESLANVMKKQATACDKRRKEMMSAASKDSEDVKNAAKAEAWSKAIDAILADKSISANIRNTFSELKKYL